MMKMILCCGAAGALGGLMVGFIGLHPAYNRISYETMEETRLKIFKDYDVKINRGYRVQDGEREQLIYLTWLQNQRPALNYPKQKCDFVIFLTLTGLFLGSMTGLLLMVFNNRKLLLR